MVESPEPVALTAGISGVLARNARPLWKPTEPAAPMDTTTQGISEKRASEASAERSSSTSSVVKLVPRRPLISVRLGLTSSGLTSDLSAASSEAPEVSSSTLAPAFSAMPVILA